VTSVAGPLADGVAVADGPADVAEEDGAAELGSGVAPSLDPLGVAADVAADVGAAGDEHAARASAAIDASTARRLISGPVVGPVVGLVVGSVFGSLSSCVTRVASSLREPTAEVGVQHQETARGR